MKADEEEEKQPRHQQQGQMYNSGGGMNYYTPMYNDGTMYMDHQTNRMNGHMQPQHTQMRDAREGNSPKYRRMYMEGKHQKDPQKQMQELENYMHELTNDIMEMIEDATPEEKQLLRQKITTLSTKIK
jgi:predicted transcriptional regulator